MALTKITGEGVGAVDNLTVDTNTLHVDAANNRVGVGSVSPDTNLDIERSSNDSGGIKVQNTNNSQANAVAQIEISGGDNAYSNLLMECNSTDHSIRQDGSGNLKFINGSTERLRILSGGGLTFNGDTAAANALDDYEEGTWTPSPNALYGFSQGGSASYSGNYVKIGDLVYVNCSLDFDTSETLELGDRFIIQGIPFTMTGSKNGVGGGSFIQPGSFSSGTHVVGTVASNSQSQDELMCVVTRVNGTPPALDNTNVNCGITYRLTNTFS